MRLRNRRRDQAGVEDPGELVQQRETSEGERGDGKCGNEVTWSLAERGDSPMRNVLRLETKGCRGRGGGRIAWEGTGAYVIYRIREGVEERLWGIPREIP
jgi:hypothetical protein